MIEMTQTKSYKAYSMTEPSTQRAIARCRKIRPKVRRVAEMTFTVSGSKGSTYSVEIKPLGSDKFIAECGCEAGRADMRCFHAIAAYTVWAMLTSQNSGATRRPANAPDGMESGEASSIPSLPVFSATEKDAIANAPLMRPTNKVQYIGGI